MPGNVAEFIDSNGVLRALLSKIVNNEPIAVYPHTSSDVVDYKNSTVKIKLDDLSNLFTNLGNLMDNTIKDLRNLQGDTFNKNYINASLEAINNLILTNKTNISNLQELVNALDVYNKAETDQKVTALTESTAISLAELARNLNNLNSFIAGNYATTNDVVFRIDSVRALINNMETVFTNHIHSLFYQYKVDTASLVENEFAQYYTKSEIDSQANAIDERFNDVNASINSLKGDSTTMNIQAVTDVNSHTDAIKSDILQTQDAKITALESNLNSSIDEQTETIVQNVANLAGSVASVQTALTSRLDNVLATLSSQISSLGGQGGVVVQYDSADEEGY